MPAREGDLSLIRGPANKNGGRWPVSGERFQAVKLQVQSCNTRAHEQTEMEISGQRTPGSRTLQTGLSSLFLSLSLLSFTFLPRVRVDSSFRPLFSHSVHAPLISRLADRPARQTKKPELPERSARARAPLPPSSRVPSS